MPINSVVIELASKQAIREALHNYCRGVDRLDRELALSVWHAGAHAHYEGVFDGTGQEFVDWLRERHLQVLSTSHQITTTLVEVDGDAAASEAYGTILVQVEVEPDVIENRFVRCRYLDRWRRVDDAWRISDRHCVIDTRVTLRIARNDESNGASGSRRDTDDPSYALFAAFTTDASTSRP